MIVLRIEKTNGEKDFKFVTDISEATELYYLKKEGYKFVLISDEVTFYKDNPATASNDYAVLNGSGAKMLKTLKKEGYLTNFKISTDLFNFTEILKKITNF